MQSPYLPNVKGPNVICSRRSRLTKSRLIGIRYDTYKPRVESERIALRAVELPILMMDRSTTTSVTSAIARMGMRWCESICTSRQQRLRNLATAIPSLTCAKNFENGSPPSRANAHVNLETDASVPKIAQQATTMMADSMAEAAAFDPVAW